jgi:N-acetylmuramic acid 6-phosphate etherase
VSESSDNAARQFLAVADQFKLGALVTESSHPVTAHLSETVAASITDGLAQLFLVDRDVLEAYRRWVVSGSSERVAGELTGALRRGGKVFFTGCGSTGRLSIQLSSIWRGYWQARARLCPGHEVETRDLEGRAISVMAGGDFALIKAVEGFEDRADFGRRQIAERGVAAGDVVFAITEGGETPFVIGTAWMGVERGAKVYFVYNNPDDVLCSHVERSREILEDPRPCRAEPGDP